MKKPSVGLAIRRRLMACFVLLQALLLVIGIPICQCFFECPFHLITRRSHLLAADVGRYLQFRYSCGADAHGATNHLSTCRHWHNDTIGDIWHRLRQACHLLHSLYHLLDGICRLKDLPTLYSVNDAHLYLQSTT